MVEPKVSWIPRSCYGKISVVANGDCSISVFIHREEFIRVFIEKNVFVTFGVSQGLFRLRI